MESSGGGAGLASGPASYQPWTPGLSLDLSGPHQENGATVSGGTYTVGQWERVRQPWEMRLLGNGGRGGSEGTVTQGSAKGAAAMSWQAPGYKLWKVSPRRPEAREEEPRDRALEEAGRAKPVI